ncbi:MAG: outer membrane beta-barrel protein [Beijerinckiaceae bacterium]|jgi:outer membrane immunogenic protein
MNKLAIAALALGLASPALAADLPNRYNSPQNDYYAPPPVFTWTGLYAGLNGALAAGRFSNGGNAAFGNSFGGLGGLTAGYNYQSGSLLVGAEGDFAFGSAQGSGVFNNTAAGNGQVQNIDTARVRFGYIYDHFLFYVTGGYAGGNVHGSVIDTSANPNLLISQSQYLNGWTIGTGVEVAVTNHISVKGEYLFTQLGGNNFFNGTRDQLNSGLNLNLIRVGANYRF